MSYDWKVLAEQLFPVLKDSSKALWDREEDVEFLKTVAEDAGWLLAQQLQGEPGLEAEIQIVTETVRQRALQKGLLARLGAWETFERILAIVIRTAKAVL